MKTPTVGSVFQLQMPRARQRLLIVGLTRSITSARERHRITSAYVTAIGTKYKHPSSLNVPFMQTHVHHETRWLWQDAAQHGSKEPLCARRGNASLERPCPLHLHKFPMSTDFFEIWLDGSQAESSSWACCRHMFLFQCLQIKKGGPLHLEKTGTTIRFKKKPKSLLYTWLPGIQLRPLRRDGGSAASWQLGACDFPS